MKAKDLTIIEHSHGGRRKNAGRKTQYQEKTVVMRVPESKVLEIKAWLQPKPEADRIKNLELHPIQIRTQLEIPYRLDSVAADFPSPAHDYSDDFLHLNEYLIHNRLTTF